jgi:hypothetical protein
VDEVHRAGDDEALYAPRIARLPVIDRTESELDYVARHPGIDCPENLVYGLRYWGVIAYRGVIEPDRLRVCSDVID